MNAITNIRDDRVVKSRDSATAILRRLGVAKSRYPGFIERLPEGGWLVHVFDASRQAFSGASRAPRAPTPGLANTAPRAGSSRPHPKPRSTGGYTPREGSIAAACFALFNEGASNADAWASIRPTFKLADDRAWYVGWYRAYFMRRGVLKATVIPSLGAASKKPS